MRTGCGLFRTNYSVAHLVKVAICSLMGLAENIYYCSHPLEVLVNMER